LSGERVGVTFEQSPNKQNNMKTYQDHPYSQIFPMMESDDRQRLRDSLEVNGQLAPVVLYEGKILDGRNTSEVLIDELKIEPRYVQYEALPKEERGNSPLEFVMARNHDRRHLSKSQLAAVAAESLPFFEELAKQRASHNGEKQDGARDPLSQETGHDDADESQARGGGKKKSGKVTAAAGKAFGISPRQVERAKALQKKDPKKFKAVKEGKLKLTKAERDEKKAKSKRQEYDDAVKRIGQVSGKAMADAVRAGTILKGRKEAMGYAELSDADMLKTRGLISAGWKLAAARKYKMTALTHKNSIGDLATRALAQGVAKQGAFTLELTHNGVALEINVRKAKED
jgi:hypothetical protein